MASGAHFHHEQNGRVLEVESGGEIIVKSGATLELQAGSTFAGLGAVGVLTETHTAASFTDGGGAVGTKTMTGSVPAGAVILATKVLVPAGFAGDVSAVLTIGDGTDVDRYNTGTINVFATAADGVQSGIPSGNKLVTVANQPVLTVTSAADFTPVLAGGGSITVSIYYA